LLSGSPRLRVAIATEQNLSRRRSFFAMR